MADEHSPTIEIAPTVIVSNSDEGETNVEATDSGETPDLTGASELSSSDNGNATEDGEPPVIAVAEIEATRDIALAEIGASVERERIAAQSEHDGELEECRREIQELREAVTALQETVLSLTPPPVLEVVEEQLETHSEPSLTHPSTAAPTTETMTEALEESVEESPVEEIQVARGRKFIAI